MFEKGFTGYNGREGKSTGIGLYLCRRVMDRLNHGSLSSPAPGRGRWCSWTFQGRRVVDDPM